MDNQRKRQLIEEYKNRKPEMGVISFRCTATGEAFLGASRDARADINSNRFRLSANLHPNKGLQLLWNRYGEGGFVTSVASVLKYDDPQADHSGELEELLAQCLHADRAATRIWK